MTEEQIALARRAIACPKWRWMPGMRAVAVRPAPLEPVCSRVPDDPRGWTPYPGALPDLTDPATLGCVLALVREAWDDECLCILPVDYGPGGVRWACRLTATGTFCTGQFWPTEIGALVDALEAGHKRGEHLREEEK
jgi:hypothetical protein